MTDTTVVIVSLIILAFYFAAFALSIAQYIITSYSIYTIAKRRLIENAFLAFIPYGNYWILGSIADDYDGKSGFNYNWRKLLIIFPIVICAAMFLFFIIFSAAFIFIESTMYSHLNYGVMFAIIISVFIMYILILLFAVAFMIIEWICIYKVFESTVPEKAIKYLLISMIVPFGYPICLLRCKDKGYYNIPPQPPFYPAPDFSAYPPPPPPPFEYRPDDMHMPN